MAAPSGIGEARRTSVHRSGGNSPGLNGFAQLVSSNKLAHSAAFRIDMDRPFDDALNGAGGLAGGRHGGLAAIVGPLSRQVGVIQQLGQGDGLILGLGQFGLQAVDAPGLDAGEGRCGEQGGEQGADHASFSVTGMPEGFRRITWASGKATPMGQRIPTLANRLLAIRVMLTAFPWFPPRT